MNTERAKTIEGWMLDDELEWLAEQASTRKDIVEVGSWMGRSTRALADNTPGIVTAVDAWDTSLIYPEMQRTLADKPKDWIVDEFRRNMEGAPYTIVRATSLEAAKILNLKRFDMIFIDASHETEDVKADILAWRPLLKEGGLLCGHDYNWERVNRAVLELIPEAKEAASGNIWQVGL